MPSFIKVPIDDSNCTVDVEVGSCTCKAGKFCKHQCDVYQFFRIHSVNSPSISAADRYEMAKLMLHPFRFMKNFILCITKYFFNVIYLHRFRHLEFASFTQSLPFENFHDTSTVAESLFEEQS